MTGPAQEPQYMAQYVTRDGLVIAKRCCGSLYVRVGGLKGSSFTSDLPSAIFSNDVLPVCRFWSEYRAFRCARSMLTGAGLAVPKAPPPSESGDINPSVSGAVTRSDFINKQRGRDRLGQVG